MAERNNAKSVSKFVNKEFSGMVLLLFSAFILFCLFTGGQFFYPFGEKVQYFFMGSLGYFSFPLFFFTLLSSLMLIVGRTISNSKTKRSALKVVLITFMVFALVQLISCPVGSVDFKTYVKTAFNSPKTGAFNAHFGGAFFATLVFVSTKALSVAGAYMLYVAVLVILSLFFLKDFIVINRGRKEDDEEETQQPKEERKVEQTNQPVQPQQAQQPINVYYGTSPMYQPQQTNVRNKRKLVLGNSSFDLKTDEDYEPKVNFGSQNIPFEKSSSSYSGNTYYSEDYNKGVASDNGYVKSTERVSFEKPQPKYSTPSRSVDYVEDFNDEEPINDFEEPEEFKDLYIPENYKEEANEEEVYENEPYIEEPSIDNEIDELEVEQVSSASDDNLIDFSKITEKPFDFDSSEADFEAEEVEEKEEIYNPVEKPITPRKAEVIRPVAKKIVEPKEKGEQLRFNTNPAPEEKEEEVNPIDAMPFNYKYNAPPSSLLNTYDSTNDYGQIEAFKMDKSEKIMNVLKILGGIEVKVVKIVDGPTVTRFEIAIPENVTVKSVLKYAEDLKLRLATEEEIRISPVKGTPFIGIEIPNKVKKIVGLKEIVDSEPFLSAKPNTLTFAIGKDLVGNPVVTDICKMPHLLVAGATGTGKSVGLNSMLVSLMMKYSPADLRFVIVDPKMVEFAVFENSPHMLFNEILFTSEKAVSMLDWAVEEMDARYMLFRKALVQGIDDYNAQLDTRKHHKMYRIVIIIDEFADLMSKNKKQIEEKIGRLAQKARAAGIYLVLATQRPSVNIMEGSIKANITSRIAFKVSNAIDSQTILSEGGAEKLLGKGDLLYRTSTMPSVERCQGAFISMDEIKKIMAYIKENNVAYYNEKAHKIINHEDEPQIESVTGRNAGDDGRVPIEYVKALKFAVESKTVSISLIQRRLGYGFPKAAKIVDWMVENKYVLNSQVGKQKQVVLSLDEFEEEFGQYGV